MACLLLLLPIKTNSKPCFRLSTDTGERERFPVQTPWAVFQNMAILRLTATQDAETNVITDFEVTFKLIRMASTIFRLPISSGCFSAQNAANQNLGTSTPPFRSGVRGYP